MGLADDMEGLEQLRRSGALTDEEFSQAKQRVLAGEAHTRDDAVPARRSSASEGGTRGRMRFRRVQAIAVGALVVLAAAASWISVGMTWDGDEQRDDESCAEIAEDLAADGRPMAELYPTLRGMGCGEWLDEQFEDNS